MNTTRHIPLLILLMMSLTSGLRADTGDSASPPVVATTPAPKATKFWAARHKLLVGRAATETATIRLVFVGDSITQGWEGGGKENWDACFAKYGALNLGISGDQTEHVLWRLQHGEWPASLKPKVAVVMIGTNNTRGGHKPEDTAKGVLGIVREIHTRSPGTTILLLPIFPRGATPADKLRLVNDKVNAEIVKLDGKDNVKVVDFGAKFLDGKGGLSKTIMPDLLHPNAKGYKIWADAIAPEIAKLIPTETK